ncbi:hypothetical protein M011DRAFT_494638 [Sporormia fimetaria CBS 119925]|uniref:Helicase C-terminal domain-containing protein n=1 Tax=Sporormia fimetaria CBS 119925 TaxID=1340428 RepID=A0A6A6VBT1_9PLEO|nr:hypothetical protein M011DRAFT_494638 [Sporormia fimetaria CBS 119925]
MKLNVGKIDRSLPPLDNIEDIFAHMASKALEFGLGDVIDQLNGQALNVATMCSGTESPLIATQLLRNKLEEAGAKTINVCHLFSAEIDPMKQGFIERNFQPNIWSRDVMELIAKGTIAATTAYGAKVRIPGKLFLLIAGFVCKDLSSLNSYKKTLEEGGETGDTWRATYAYAERFRPSIVLLENVGIRYECAWVYCDTKDYYLPQTRQRMYMIAVDRDQYGKDAAKVVAKCKTVMLKLQRPASSPFDAFLSSSDDPYVYAARASESDWAMCKLRYDHIRANKRLGTKNPITQASENGSIRPPDVANMKWYRKQSTRVYDAIDIAHLQAAADGYDSQYKMMVWDVSQNVDRFTSATAIVPCITPSGCDFVTNKQTALSGEQLLLLQGMSNSKLLFARETEKDRQDLAGNAMSTTVIGASIIAPLVSGKKMLGRTKAEAAGKSAALLEAPAVNLVTPKTMDARTLEPPRPDDLEIEDLRNDARRSSRMCNCEGPRHVSKYPVRVCRDCGHTACSSHAGNPKHFYADATVPPASRMRPADFESKWRPRLPVQLRIASFPDLEKLAPDLTSTKAQAQWQAFLTQTKEAIVDTTPLYLTKFQREEQGWIVGYEAVHVRLELRIQDELRWYLFLKCPPTVAANNAPRKTLSHPLARALVKDSLLQPKWELHIPHAGVSSIRLLGSSQQTKSWRNRLGLLDYRNETVPSSIEVRSEDTIGQLNGTFTLLPHCGTAMSSLYKRERNDGDAVYLFFDPDPVEDVKSDTFVFAADFNQLSYGQARVTFAKLDPSLRPWNLLKGKSADINVATVGRWTSANITLSAAPTRVEVRLPSARQLTESYHGDCTQAITMLDVNIPTLLPVKQYADYSWALEHARREPLFTNWTLYGRDCSGPSCSCAPDPPQTLWHVDEKGGPHAYEDRLAASQFERSLKMRPPIITVRADSQRSGKTHIRVGLNVASLVHRAKNRLRRFAQCDTSWRLVTSHTDVAQEKFKNFSLPDNSQDEEFSGKLALRHPLEGSQKRSLIWMRKQETGIKVTVTEVEEAIHAELGWRAEARAQAEVTIRGGILADLPSFGKTVTTIGLIESEFAENKAETLVKTNAQSNPGGLVDVAATLIVCPSHLVKQWSDEFLLFLGKQKYNDYGIRAISKLSQLSNLTIKDIQVSRVIIVSWTLLANNNYVDILARFGAVPEPTTLKGRAYDAWLDYVVGQLPERVAELKSKGPVAFDAAVDDTIKARLQNDNFKAIVPLKVLHGSAYQAHKKKQTMEKKTASASKKKNAIQKKCPLLQMFSFNRVNSAAFAAAKRISGHKRWLLSGTLPLTSFSDLEQRIADEQTDVENFMNRTETHSYRWHQDRHERAQDFLDRFARQNEPCLKHIKCTELLRPIELDVAHYTVYLELSQHLTRRTCKTNRLHESLENSSTAEEALVRSALKFKTDRDAESALNVLLKKRRDQIDSTKRELIKLMAPVERWQPGNGPSAGVKNTTKFKDGYKSGNKDLGDSKANQFVRDAILEAEAAPKRGEKKVTAGQPLSKEDMKRLTSNLGILAMKLRVRLRSLRFVESIETLLPGLGKERPEKYLCDSPDCSGCQISELHLVSECGHRACEKCLQTRSDTEACVDKDCRVYVRSANLIKATSLVACQGEPTHIHRNSFGAKLDAIAQLLQTAVSKDDQALIFMPSDDTIEIMEDVLGSHNISYLSVSEKTSNPDVIMEEFQKPGCAKKVLILNMDSETASGTNLVNANHVIFVSPLLAESQYKYEFAMNHAIARCRRYRQKKKVFIYHFAALRTIDVDILQHRHKRVDAIYTSEKEEAAGAKRQAAAEKSTRKEKTIFVENTAGEMALVPISWLEDDTKRDALGVPEGDNYKACAHPRGIHHTGLADYFLEPRPLPQFHFEDEDYTEPFTNPAAPIRNPRHTHFATGTRPIPILRGGSGGRDIDSSDDDDDDDDGSASLSETPESWRPQSHLTDAGPSRTRDQDVTMGGYAETIFSLDVEEVPSDVAQRAHSRSEHENNDRLPRISSDQETNTQHQHHYECSVSPSPFSTPPSPLLTHNAHASTLLSRELALQDAHLALLARESELEHQQHLLMNSSQELLLRERDHVLRLQRLDARERRLRRQLADLRRQEAEFQVRQDAFARMQEVWNQGRGYESGDWNEYFGGLDEGFARIRVVRQREEEREEEERERREGLLLERERGRDERDGRRTRRSRRNAISEGEGERANGVLRPRLVEVEEESDWDEGA